MEMTEGSAVVTGGNSDDMKDDVDDDNTIGAEDCLPSPIVALAAALAAAIVPFGLVAL